MRVRELEIGLNVHFQFKGINILKVQSYILDRLLLSICLKSFQLENI